MESFLIDAEILTPIIMAGAETALPEIRTQSIKGLLRWWYRFYKSSLVNSLDELKKAEAEIWGSTDKASLIKLQILSKPDSTQYAHLCMNDQRTKPPASKPYDKIKRKSYYPHATFQLKLSFSPFCTLSKKKEVIISLWLLSMLGGIGARWRRGFGSIKLKINNQTEYEDFSFEYPANRVEEILKTHLYNNASQWTSFSSNFPTLKNTKIYYLKPSDYRWNTWQQVMNDLRDKFYRTFKKKIGLSSIGSANPRKPSPLAIQIKQTQAGDFFGIVLVFRKYFRQRDIQLEINDFLKEQTFFQYKEVTHV